MTEPTIVAAATPPGRGGVAIVRLSGSRVPVIARALLGTLPVPRQASRHPFRAADGAPIDFGLALYFPAPHSYTGEPILELQGHGGPVLVEALIQRAIELGARRAAPGEFTQRAYLNGKLDLAQAEAVADLIDAASQSAARAALRTLQGEFSQQVLGLREALSALRVQVEAAIDFADEDIGTLGTQALAARLQEILLQLGALRASATQGRLLTEGITVVIAGLPNAGKSTLFNRLTGMESAIVTHLPGTTRDVLRERIRIDGVPVLLLDTAGLRHPGDVIEEEGIRRAHAAMVQADHILFVIDGAADPGAQAYRSAQADLPALVPVTVVLNKSDLMPAAPAGAAAAMISCDGRLVPTIRLCARNGEGLEALKTRIKECAGYDSTQADVLSARARHTDALRLVHTHLVNAATQLGQHTLEIVAEELRQGHAALGEIVGVDNSDDLLGRIFSSFCIGK